MISQIWKEIRQKKFSPLYLLYGKEEFLLNKTKKLIIDNALNEEELEFNLSLYDLEETPIEVALEDCQTFPFFGERKIVIVQNPYFLTAEKVKEKVEHNVKALEEYITNPVPSTIFILMASYEKLDERKKLVKGLKKNAVVFEAKELAEKELKDWIQQVVTEQGFQITNTAIDLLYQLIGSNLTQLNNELEKLFLYRGQGVIDEQMIQLLVAKSLEDNVFSLVDHVVNRQLKATLEIYYDMLKLNEEPIKIVAIIANQLRIIYQIKTLQKKGYGEKQIASLLKIHPFRVKLAIPQTKKFNEERLLEMINYLADLDYKMKTGAGNKEKLLEIFFIRFLQN